jgi:hypothetical protein
MNGAQSPFKALTNAGLETPFDKARAQKGPSLIEAAMAQDLQPFVDLIMQMRQAKAQEGNHPA